MARFRKKGAIYASLVSSFPVIAIIAAALGYGGIAADAAEIAKVLFFIFLEIFFVTLVLGLVAGQKYSEGDDGATGIKLLPIREKQTKKRVP